MGRGRAWAEFVAKAQRNKARNEMLRAAASPSLVCLSHILPTPRHGIGKEHSTAPDEIEL